MRVRRGNGMVGGVKTVALRVRRELGPLFEGAGCEADWGSVLS